MDGHRRRAAGAAALGAIALVVGVVATGVGPGRAEAAVVTGRIGNAAGGCLENANNATTANNPLQRWTPYTAGYLQNRKSGTCLAPLGNRVCAGVAVVVTTCANVAAQRWTLPAVSTPSTTTPTTTTRNMPTQTAQTWSSDFTGSGFGKFDDAPWNYVGASAPTIVASPVTPGAKAAQFTMPAKGTRTEVVPTTAEFTEGQDRWFRFSFYLPANFPTQLTTWQVITQWKNDGDGSPPLEITVGKGSINLEGGYGYPGAPRTFAQALAPATTGQRTDLVLHVFFSRDRGKGVVDVWDNGTQVLAGYKPAGGTLYPTTTASTASLSSYWKMGIYRDNTVTQQAQYTIEGAKVGNTRDQVS